MTRYNRSYLFENTTSDNRSRARRYMRDNSGMSKDESMQLDHQLQTQFKNVGGCECKFMLGLTRMYMNGELEGTIGEHPNEVSIASLVNQALGIVTEKPYSEQFDFNLNGMSAMQFIDIFKDKIQAAGNADKDNLSNQDFGGNKGYDIVLIDSFEKAKRYAKYTTWCVTESDSAYDNYTKGGTFYFCLKNGFENVERVAGTNTPLDEYGLSMIAVSIYPDGKCNTITCRWNHDNGGSDNIMTTERLSKVIGENFYDVFKPAKSALTLGGKEYVVGVIGDNGRALYDEYGHNVLGEGVKGFYVDEKLTKRLGCDVLVVEASFGKNFLKFQNGKAQYLFDEWIDGYDYNGDLSKQLGFPCFWVWTNQKGHYIMFKDGEIEYPFDGLFDNCICDSRLSEQLGAPCLRITNGEKCNCIIFKDKNPQYLFDEWFYWYEYNGELSRQLGTPCIVIENGRKRNWATFKDEKTQYLFDEWFDNYWYDYELSEQLGAPCFIIINGEKRNWVIVKDNKPQYLFDEWFDRCDYDRWLSKQLNAPCIEIKNGGKYNLVILKDKKPQYLFDEWFDAYYNVSELTKQLGVPCYKVINGDNANIAMYQNGEMHYLFNRLVKRDDLEETVYEYLRQLEQRNENRVKHISRVITEMIIRKLR